MGMNLEYRFDFSPGRQIVAMHDFKYLYVQNFSCISHM